jgi:hypothetical protein
MPSYEFVGGSSRCTFRQRHWSWELRENSGRDAVGTRTQVRAARRS